MKDKNSINILTQMVETINKVQVVDLKGKQIERPKAKFRFKSYLDLMRVNKLISYLPSRETKNFLKKLRKIENYDNITGFSTLIENLNIKKIFSGRDFRIDKLYDFKWITYFLEPVNSSVFKLKSTDSRFLIKEMNMSLFKKLLRQAKDISRNNNGENSSPMNSDRRSSRRMLGQRSFLEDQKGRQENPVYENFKNHIVNICDLQKDKKQLNLTKVLRKKDTDYLLYALELGVIEDNILPYIQNYLLNYVDAINEELKEISKHKQRGINEEDDYDEEELSSHNEVDTSSDDSSTNSESSSKDGSSTSSDTQDNGMEEQSSERAEKREKQGDRRRSLTTSFLHFDRKRKHQKTSEEGDDLKKQQLIRQLKTILSKLKKIARILFLLISSENDKSIKLALEDSKKEVKFYFEDSELIKTVTKIIMNILTYINEFDTFNIISCFETSVGDEPFFQSVNKIFMSFLSIRNDPFIKSMEHYPKDKGFILTKDEIREFSKSGIKTFEGERSGLIKKYQDLLSISGLESSRSEKKILSNILDNELIKQIGRQFDELMGHLNLDNEKKLDKVKLQLTVMNFPSIILHILHLLYESLTGTGEKNRHQKKVYSKGLDLLQTILIKNHLGQNFLFSKKSSFMFWQLIGYKPVKFLSCLFKIFSQGSEVVFKSSDNFTLLMDELKQIIKKHDINRKEDVTDKENIMLTYMINTLIEQLLRNNVDNSEERNFTALFHKLYGDKMKDNIRAYFDDKDNHEFLAKKYEPVLIGKHFDEHLLEESLNFSESGEEANMVESMKAEMYYSFLKLYNESTENWNHESFTKETNSNLIFTLMNPTPTTYKERNQDGDSLDEENRAHNPKSSADLDDNENETGKAEKVVSYHFEHTIKKNVEFSIQLMRLYCNESVFEFQEDLIEMKKKNKMKHIQRYSKEISALLGTKGKLIFSPEQDNEKKMYNMTLLKIVYKYFQGISFEISPIKYEETGILEVMQSFTLHWVTNSDDYSRDGNKTLEKLKNTIGKKISFFEDSLRKRKKKGTWAERIAAEQCLESIIKKICLAFAEKKESEMVEDLTRESHTQLQSEETRIFDLIDTTGSVSLKQLKKQVTESKERAVQLSGELNQLNQSSSRSRNFNKIESLRPKNQKQTDFFLFMHNSYLQKKRKFIKDKSNFFFKELDEGGDNGGDSDYCYKLLLRWIIEIFYQKINTKHLKTKDQSQSFNPGSSIKINQGTKYNDQVNYGNKILTEFDLYNWVHVLDNLLIVKPKTRTIFFENFFSDSLMVKEYIIENYPKRSTLCLNRYSNKLSHGIFTLLKQERLENYIEEIENNSKGRKNQRYRSLANSKKNIVSIVRKADIFTSILFESALYLQKCIRSEIFNRSFAVNLEYYFSIGSLIKSLAEKNCQGFKNYVGKLKKSVVLKSGKSVVKSYIDLFYDGLYLYTGERKKKLVRKDRPHLYWFNILTIQTLTEYFNGPCVYNQQHSLKNFIKLFHFVKRSNCNTTGTFYILQKEVMILVQALFEGESKSKCQITNKAFKPKDFYLVIVKHMEQFYNDFKQKRKLKKLAKNRSKKRKKSRKPDQSDSDSEEEKKNQKDKHKQKKKSKKELHINKRLLKYYKKQKDFSSHPILSISMGLLRIMKTIARFGNNSYRKFLSEANIEMAVELRASNDLELTDPEKGVIERKTKTTLSFFNFIKKKDDNQGNFYENEEEKNTRINRLNYFLFINQITASIEILNDQRQPTTVFFQVHPECLFLTNETKSSFLLECNIDDVNTKLLGLMNNVMSFKIEMESNLSLYRWLGKFSSFTNESTFTFCMKITWCLSIILNIFVLLGYEWKDGEFGLNSPYTYLVKGTTVLLIFIAGLFLALWIIFKYQFAVEIAKNHYEGSSSKGVVLYFKKFIYKAFIKKSIPMMFSLHIFFGLSAIAAKGTPVWHSFHLLLLFFLSQTTRYVVNAITRRSSQVIMTFIIGVLVTYSFAIINAMNYRNDWDDMTSGGLDMCQTMLGCFGYILDFGFRNGGGIADAQNTLPFVGKYGGTRYWWKIIMNLTFFILISKFALDIIFGIIIDTFTDMRDAQQRRTEIMRDKCFICNFERREFEQNDKSFKFHRENQHNIWNYVNYLIYIIKKDSLDYDGIEYFVKEKWDGNSTEWFPIGKTLYLMNEEDLVFNFDDMNCTLENIEESVSKIVDKVVVGIKNTKVSKRGGRKLNLLNKSDSTPTGLISNATSVGKEVGQKKFGYPGNANLRQVNEDPGRENLDQMKIYESKDYDESNHGIRLPGISKTPGTISKKADFIRPSLNNKHDSHRMREEALESEISKDTRRELEACIKIQIEKVKEAITEKLDLAMEKSSKIEAQLNKISKRLDEKDSSGLNRVQFNFGPSKKNSDKGSVEMRSLDGSEGFGEF